MTSQGISTLGDADCFDSSHEPWWATGSRLTSSGGITNHQGYSPLTKWDDPQVVSVLKYDSWRNINYRNSWMVAKKQEINNDNHLLMLIPQRLTLIMTRSEHNLVWGLTITRVPSELLTGTEDLLVTFNFATINKPFGSLIYSWQMVIFHAKLLNDQKAYGHFWGGCRYWEVLGIYNECDDAAMLKSCATPNATI